MYLRTEDIEDHYSYCKFKILLTLSYSGVGMRPNAPHVGTPPARLQADDRDLVVWKLFLYVVMLSLSLFYLSGEAEGGIRTRGLKFPPSLCPACNIPGPNYRCNMGGFRRSNLRVKTLNANSNGGLSKFHKIKTPIPLKI